jgi:methylmalonyl-CoA epimerase
MDESPLAIHHVGVAVPSIDDAMHFYGDKLGLSLVDSVDLPDRQLKVAFVQAANMLIELLEPTDPNSSVSRFLERRGPGLHHLCFGTTDIRRHLRDLADKGVELIDAEPRPGARGEVAFLHPSAALGVLVELTQDTDGTTLREIPSEATTSAETPATETPGLTPPYGTTEASSHVGTDTPGTETTGTSPGSGTPGTATTGTPPGSGTRETEARGTTLSSGTPGTDSTRTSPGSGASPQPHE